MANLNRDAINKQRELNSQPSLTDAEWAALNGGNGNSSDAEKEALAKKSEEERLAAEAQKKIEDDAAAAAAKLLNTPAPDPVITDDILFAELSKRGIKATSLDDLRNREELDRERLAEERENEKLAWGLKNKKINKKEYEGYVAAVSDPEALVYQIRLQAAKKEDPALDEQTFRAEFEEEFGIDQPTTSRRHKNGQDTLQRIAEAALKHNFSSVYNLENEYSSFENSQKQLTAQQTKIKESAPAYKKTIDKVFSELKKVTTKFSDDDVYEVEVLEDSMAALKGQMSEPAFASQQIIAGYSEETLKEIAFTTLLRNNFPIIAKKIAEQHLKKHAAGLKGIPPVGKRETQEGVVELTPQMETLKTMIAQNKPVAEQAN